MNNISENNLYSDFLLLARKSVQIGAKEWSSFSRESIPLLTKESVGDIATEFDQNAERKIKDYLSSNRPEDQIVGEEYGVIGPEDAAYTWCIDPIDGTSNFVRGLPHVATSVAVRDNSTGDWVAGSVFAAFLGAEYYAQKGGGAWVERKSLLDQASSVQRLTGPVDDRGPRLFGTGFSYHPALRSEQYRELPELMGKFTDVRAIGSAALGMCLAAEGTLTAFDESDLFEYDWAAGAVIAAEAGMVVNVPREERGRVTVYPSWIL